MGGRQSQITKRDMATVRLASLTLNLIKPLGTTPNLQEGQKKKEHVKAYHTNASAKSSLGNTIGK